MGTIKIGLLWHSLTSDNLGVGALTESQIAICTAACDRLGLQPKFTVIGTRGSRKPDPDPRVTIGTPVSVRRTIRGDAPYLDELQACDVVLDIGEGDSFTDIYGMYRFAFLWAAKVGVLRRKVPLALSPQTIGPFKRFHSRWLAGWAMKRCYRVFCRDHASTEYTQKMGVTKNLSEAVDVAFRLPFDQRPHAGDGKIHVGLNPSGLLMSGGYEGTNQFGLSLDYRRLMFRLLDDWTARGDVVVWLVPHVMADDIDRDNDMVAIEELRKKYPTCQVAPRFESPSKAKTFISGLDFFTGARMHACIAAISSGVAVVPLAYSRKFNGLFKSLDYPYLADGLQDTEDSAYKKISDGLAQRQTLKAQADKSRALAAGKLQKYEDFLVEFFGKFAKR